MATANMLHFFSTVYGLNTYKEKCNRETNLKGVKEDLDNDRTHSEVETAINKAP